MRFATGASVVAGVASVVSSISDSSSTEPLTNNSVTKGDQATTIITETVISYRTVYTVAFIGSDDATTTASWATLELPGPETTPIGTKGGAYRNQTRPTEKVAKPFGRNEEYFHQDTEGDVKMQPCTHWDFDTEDYDNLLPNIEKQFYYAEGGSENAKPTNEFYFGIIDLLFKAPAVLLEQSTHIRKAEYSDNRLVVDFSCSHARDVATGAWQEGTIIVSSTAGCKASFDDDQCYFVVDDVVEPANSTFIIVTGYPQARDECTEGGNAHWGRYKPEKNRHGLGNQPDGNSSCLNASSTNPLGNLSAMAIHLGSYVRPSSSQGPYANKTEDKIAEFGDEKSSCKAPIDTKYNLTTACTGSFFDLDLDEAIGYGKLSNDDLEFLLEATTGLASDPFYGLTRRAAIHRRHLQRRGLWSWFKNKVAKPFVKVLKKVVVVGGAVVKAGYQLVTTGTISAGSKQSFNFALPDGNKADSQQVDSPWGPAALIAAYGTESKIKADKGVQRDGYLNIYCVGCGAQGRVEIAGRATWSVRKGITKGEIEAWADLRVAMKVGVDAQIKLTREWKKDLFKQGLPGLQFGPVIIGPQIRLSSRVTLEAGAEGRILAGAEMNWNRAYAKVDFVDPSKSTRENFDPIGHPILEAEGSLYIGAELGLPIGLHFGITVASWSKTVGLINEPMVKGIAKAAVKAELADGKLTAGFTPTEGCQGIHANLSWRNKLVCNVLDIKEFKLLDTGYKSIKSLCIPIGKQVKPPMQIREGKRQTSYGDTNASGQDQTIRRSLIHRQNSLNTTNSTSAENLPADVIEITEDVKWANEDVNYALPEVESAPYERTDGFIFTKLLSGDYNVMYCSNGNMYLKDIAEKAGLGCDELFAYSEHTVVGDGQGRYFYFHKDSMLAAGVSRFRLGDDQTPVKGTTAVAMPAWSAAETDADFDAEIEGLYVVADYNSDNMYWLTFCTYTDKQPPKVFIVSDLDAGLAVLESGDFKYSVTGGNVDKCYPLMAKEDTALRDTWAEWDESLEDDSNGLEFEWSEASIEG